MKRILTWVVTAGFLFGLTLFVQAGSEQPKRGGTLTFATSKKMKLMNPLVSTSSTEKRIRDLMFEPLLGMDRDGDIKPNLAESWEVSKDGLLYTFHLRKGVKFHDGKEMTAEDVKYAVDYTLNPKNGGYGYEDIKAIERAEAPDRYTLTLRLKHRDTVLLTALTDIRSFSVIPKESLPEGVKKPKKFPAGTGPFKFVEWVPGQRLVLQRFDDYWGHKAYIDKLVLKPIGDATVRFTALRAGDVDLVERTANEWVDQIVSGKLKGIGYAKAAYAGARNIEFNVADPPFNNKKLRLAVASAIDRKEILQAAYLGLAEPSNQRFPAGNVWNFTDVSLPKHDLDMARKLLKEAGYKGETIELLGNQGEVAEVEGAVIQAQLKKIGMNIKLIILERASNLDRRHKGEYAFKLAGGSLYPDPLLAYSEYRCEKDLKNRGENESGYCDKQFDTWVDEASQELNPEKRKALFRKVVGKLADDIPILPIGFTPRFFTFNNHIKGFTTDANGASRWWGGGLNYTWIDR
jgi:peptide/nickel transport system substrate-binding protein